MSFLEGASAASLGFTGRAWGALGGVARGARAAGQYWLETPMWYGAKSLFGDPAVDRAEWLLEHSTIPDPRGKGLWNAFTGRRQSPLAGGLILGAGVGYGVIKGLLTMEEMKATGRITGPMPAPFLAYDFVPNYEMFSIGTPREAPPPEDRGQRGKRRVTPRRAEDLEAGGDLVFALRNAYGT